MFSYSTRITALIALALLWSASLALAQDTVREVQQLQNQTDPAPAATQPSIDDVPYRPKTELDPGATMITSAPRWANVNGVPTAVRPQQSLHSGVMVPDGRGGYIWMGANTPLPSPDPANEDAQELKLKIRELADQLLSNDAGGGIGGLIVLPTSFVNQDNFEQTSSFGRFITEQMFHELSLRGVAVREYRQAPEIVSKKGAQEGDYMLSRGAGNVTINSKRAAVLVGTYYADNRNAFVQARLINGATGMVLRTAQVTVPLTRIAKKMVRNSTGASFSAAPVGLRDFNQTLQSTQLQPVKPGQDVH